MDSPNSGFSVIFSIKNGKAVPPSLPQGWSGWENNADHWTVVSKGGPVSMCRHEHLTGIIAGNPYWRNGERISRDMLCHRLLHEYLKQGPSCVNLLAGSFAFVILNSKDNVIEAANDRLGRESLFYRQTDQALQIATSASLLADALDKRLHISHQGLFNYVFFHMVPAPGSIYDNINKLQSAHQLTFKNGQLSLNRYWTPEFSEQPINTDQAHQELKEIIQQSVAHYSYRDNLGAFLSGGLDSSTVSGVLAQQKPNAPTFSIGFDAEGYDEIAYARIASKHFGTKQHEYYVTPDDVLETVPKIAAYYDEPFGNSSALPAYFCARFARENGINCLLAGDGGDELFAGNERYAKQGVFELYQQMPGFLRHGLAEPVSKILPSGFPLLGKIKSYIQQASIGLPDRLNTYNFLRRHAADEVFTGDFLRDCDITNPLFIQEGLYNTPQDTSTLNRMLFLDWQLTLADNDLQKVNKMSQMAGIDVVYPLLDDELVEFSCRIPSEEKLPGSKLRHFYKQAMQDFLPTEIINKPKHGFGLPFGVWMKDDKRLQELAYDHLLQLKSYDYFNKDFLDQTIHMHKNVHASFYGELVWILMMLSLWLENHQ